MAARRTTARFLIAGLLVMAVSLVALSSPADAARRRAKAAVQDDRYASIVIDMGSGMVLSEQGADKKLHPASLTKMMTLYLTFEALEAGILRKNQRLPVSRYASRQEPSSLNLQPGSTIRVSDAILALVTKSANDVAVVLGEALGGSEERFGRLMTQKARALGMNNTYFRNASGLHHPAQVSSARDMATLSMALIRDYPQHYTYFRTKSFTFAGATFQNHNKLMSAYEGMDGIKTGYVHKSGFNLAASVTRNGHRVVAVVFGGRTANSRNAHMAALLDRGFARINAGDIRIASAANTNNTGQQYMASVVPQKKPQFDAMGLVMRGSAGENSYAVEEGDASDALPAALIRAAAPMNTSGDWVIQVGAFSTSEAGMNAIDQAKSRLSSRIVAAAQPQIVPLSTHYGVIYRARLSGLKKGDAADACRVLRGNCLILSAR